MKYQFKKIVLLVTVIIALTVCFAFGVCAEEHTDGYYTYTVENGEATITNFSGNYGQSDVESEITVPNILGGYPVIRIASYAFSDCSSVKSIIISEGIKYLDKSAFYFCVNIKSIIIPESVIEIGLNKEINETGYLSAFSDLQGLQKINVNDKNKFYSNDSDGVLFNKDKSILINYPLGKTNSIYSVPNSVKIIGSDAFHLSGFETESKNLTVVKIPSSVTKICSSAFGNCSSLESIKVDTDNKYFTSDEYGVLYNSTKTEIIQYPPAKNYTMFKVPERVTKLTNSAFVGTTYLKAIYIPTSVNTISAFFDPYVKNGLTTVYYQGTEEEWNKIVISEYDSIYELPKWQIEYNCSDLPHSYVCQVTKVATCLEKGKETFNCTSCGDTYTETIKAKGHTSDKGTVTKKATYKTTGTKTYKCTACKTTLTTEKVARLNLSKVSRLKASSIKTTSIKFTWNKVTGAEKYEVYYSTNGKKWTKVTTSKNSITVKKLKAGKTYKVKVRAVTGDNKGAYSSVLTTSTKPSKVTLSKLTAGKKKLTAQWKTISDVTGYEVTYSTSKKFTKKTTKTVTIKKSNTKKTTLKKLKSGKKYYVKVRAYKTVNGKKIYGAYSAVKAIKIK